MTTIAYKDGVLAADSATTGNGKYFGSVKKHIHGDGWAAAYTGGIAMAGALQDMLSNFVQDGKPSPSGIPFLANENEVVFVNNLGEVYSCWSNGCTKIEGKFYACGSGEAVALGAMAAGATAEEAVTIACEYDTATRGPVVAIRVRD